ncbi:TPA: hypothetical protein QDZ10_003514 [Stenotrophomonas maltophilia]|nr:hypothetical protein [Stenotrophomonas maltophilia]
MGSPAPASCWCVSSALPSRPIQTSRRPRAATTCMRCGWPPAPRSRWA